MQYNHIQLKKNLGPDGQVFYAQLQYKDSKEDNPAMM